MWFQTENNILAFCSTCSSSLKVERLKWCAPSNYSSGLVAFLHQSDPFVLALDKCPDPWPRLAALFTYLQLSVGLARPNNHHWGCQQGWLDSPHAAIFTPGLRFLKSKRVTDSERETQRKGPFFPTRKRFGYKYQTRNSLICQWSLPEEGGGCRVLLSSWAALNSFTNRGGEELWEE